MAKYTAKVLTLDFYAGAGAGAGAGASGTVVKAALGSPVPAGVVTATDETTAAQAASLRLYARRLDGALRAVYDATTYHRARANRHHTTLLSTELRVRWWAVAEAAVISAVAGLQVLLVMRWFSEGGGAHMLPGGGGARKAGAAGLAAPASARRSIA